jgi:RNA polymerase sigma factor (sigma-70 family)
VDYFRKQRKETTLDEVEFISTESNLLQHAIRTERLAALSRLIGALPEEDQELIRLRYVAELSFTEIGHLLRLKEDTVKKSLYRLLARLKVQADKEYPTEDSHV